MAGTNNPRTAMADFVSFTSDFVIVEVGTLLPTGSKPGSMVFAPAAPASKSPQQPRLVPPIRSPFLTVHRQVLSRSSKWLQELLSDPYVKRIRLDSDCTSWRAMSYYVNWLYFGTFATKPLQPSVRRTDVIPDDQEYLDLAYIRSACMWLEDQQAADDVVNAFVAKMKEVQPVSLPGPDCIWYLFSTTHPVQPPLRRLVAAAYAAEASAEQLNKIFAYTNEAFRVAVTAELVGLRIENRQKVASMNSCSFHGHAADEPCESNEKARKRRRLV